MIFPGFDPKTLRQQPLTGIRILAFETLVAMPFLTQILAALGATVHKIEPIKGGDLGRTGVPRIRDRDDSKVGSTFLRSNLRKQSLALNLKDEAVQALLQQLIQKGRYDLVVENSPPGRLDAWGLGYQTLSKLFPPLVYGSISGFGYYGDSPYREEKMLAQLAESHSGLVMSAAAEGERPRVGLYGAFGDIASSIYMGMAIGMALFTRERTGLGQHIDISMVDVLTHFNDLELSIWSLDESRRGGGARKMADGIYSVFRAQDGWFAVVSLRKEYCQGVARAVNHTEWIDAYPDTGDWTTATHEGPIRKGIESWAANRTKSEAARLIREAGGRSWPCLTTEEVLQCQHVRARKMILELKRPNPDSDDPLKDDPIYVVNHALRGLMYGETDDGLDGELDPIVDYWPLHGEHTTHILTEHGVPPAEIEALRARGAIL